MLTLRAGHSCRPKFPLLKGTSLYQMDVIECMGTLISKKGYLKCHDTFEIRLPNQWIIFKYQSWIVIYSNNSNPNVKNTTCQFQVKFTTDDYLQMYKTL